MWTVAKKTRVNSECVLTNRLASCATAYLTTPGAYVNMVTLQAFVLKRSLYNTKFPKWVYSFDYR